MKKVLITGIAALSLVGFTACGGSKKDPKPPEVECTSSDQCTDSAKPFCNANGVCVADPNPGTDAGITDAGLDEDAGEQDAGLNCPAEKPYEVNGECAVCPADQPYKIGDACFAAGQIFTKGSFDEFCDENVAVYYAQGRVGVYDCGEDTCAVLKSDKAAYCVPSDMMCKLGDAAKAACAADSTGEYKVNYLCSIETTTPGVGILSIDEDSKEACPVHCFEKATGPECGKNFDDEYDECDPAQFKERCETNENGTFAVWCSSKAGNKIVAPKCGEGTVCAFADDWGVDCFKPCTELGTESTLCDEEYVDYGIYNIYECVQELDAEGNSVDGKYILLELDYDFCDSGVCDLATNECTEAPAQEACDIEEYVTNCDAGVLKSCGPADPTDMMSVLGCYFGGECVVVEETCADACVADLDAGVFGCMNKWDECTVGDDPIFACYEDEDEDEEIVEVSQAFACVSTSSGKAYWVDWAEETCGEDDSCFDTENGSCGNSLGICDPRTFNEVCGEGDIGRYCYNNLVTDFDCSDAGGCISETNGNYVNCADDMDECPDGVAVGSTFKVCDDYGYSMKYSCKAMSDGNNYAIFVDEKSCGAAGCNEETGECNSK